MELGILAHFGLMTILPAVATYGLTKFRQQRAATMTYWSWQILCGLVFGCIAVLGTEFGIATHGATMAISFSNLVPIR